MRDDRAERTGPNWVLTEAGCLRVWRLVDPGRAPGLDDRESCLAGGRWSSEGVAAVYATSSLPLAVLESWVHVGEEEGDPGRLPPRVAVCLELPPDAEIEDVEDVSPFDAARARAAGDDWSRSRRSLALRVPSAVVPAESNVILNPDHPQYARLRVVSQEDCPFDPRLARGQG